MTVRIFISQEKGARASLAEVRTKTPSSIIGKGTRADGVLDLQEAAYIVPYLMSSGAVVGRGIVGPGYDIVPSSLDVSGKESERIRIMNFFNFVPTERTNIKDTFGVLSKLYTTAFMFRIFGHSAWEIIRGDGGEPLGFDLIPGVVKPNIEADGTFKNPAYTQYMRFGGTETKTEFKDPNNIVYFAVPDFGGGVWLNESLSLADYTLPSEIYSAKAFLSLHKNRNAPYSGIWFTPADVDDETFKRFHATIQARYTGAENYGRNPLVMRGEGGFKQLNTTKEDAPYVEGREMNRREVAAATGVPGAKYGVDLDKLSANALKEIRREFYESTLLPVMALIEEVLFTQVCQALFGTTAWKFKFRRPDFTTAVEDASIEMRRIQWGQWSPNEARRGRGEEARDGGDYYVIPANMQVVASPDGPPANDPVDDDQGDMEPGEENPVADTQPPERVDSGIIGEVRKWKKFQVRIATGKRKSREFSPEDIPDRLSKYISGSVAELGDDVGAVVMFFDDLIFALDEK